MFLSNFVVRALFLRTKPYFKLCASYASSINKLVGVASERRFRADYFETQNIHVAFVCAPVEWKERKKYQITKAVALITWEFFFYILITWELDHWKVEESHQQFGTHARKQKGTGRTEEAK